MMPELGVVLDAGTGMFRVRDLIETSTLDIFLSHVHLDHSIGLTFLYDILWEKDLERVTVHVEKEKIKVIEDHLYNKALFPVGPNFDFKPLSTSPLTLENGATVTNFDLVHPGGSHGFRIESGDTSIAYVTDTTASKDAAYISSITGVKTLIHECYFPDGWEDRAALTGHSCLTPVAEVAAAASAESLYLVHINPLENESEPLDLDSVKSTFSNIVITSDKMAIDV